MKLKLKKLAAWAGRRLTERSTYVGAAAIAAALGADKLGVQIGQVGEVIAIAGAAGLITASTSAATPAEG